MKLISKLVFSFFSNVIALAVAVYFISGFKITMEAKNFLMVAGAFTLINLFIRPILKLLFGPVILITFGLGTIVVNAALLWLLDFMSNDVTIIGLTPLIYATIVIGAVNLILALSAKKLFRGED